METLQAYLDATPVYVQMAILFGLAFLISTLVVIVVYQLLTATAKRIKSFTLEAFTRRTRSAVFGLLTFLLTTTFWEGLITQHAASSALTYLRPFTYLARTLLFIFLGLTLIRLVAVAADTLRYLYNADDVNNLRERKILTQLQYVQRIAAILIFVLILALILLQFEGMRSLGTGILTSAGVSGIIIGIAAQKSIANLLAGFQIAFTQPIRLDDALIVNGEYGWVEDITLTYVTMRLWDQRRQIVPLQKFIDETFQNWTHTSSDLIGTVFLYTDYTFPVAALREEVDRWLPLQTDLWDEKVKSVAVTDNDAKTMTIRILVSAVNAGTTFDLRCRTREYLIGWLRENYPGALPKTRVEMEQKG
ncbi:MAG: mechanosensitive ion channel domain-containing protein [Bacteroidota bacterium]